MNPPDLREGSVAGRALRFGIPLALAMLGHGLFNLVDLVIVGPVARGAVTAVTLGGIVVTVAMLLGDGWGNGVAARIGRAYGRGDLAAAREEAAESLRTALAAGAVLGLALVGLSPPLVALFRLGSPPTEAAAVGYLAILALGLFTSFGLIQVTAVWRGMGEGLWPLAVLIGANLANLILDLGFVYGWFGLPVWGVLGAALATGLARGLGAAVGWTWLARIAVPVRLSWPGRPLRASWARIRATAAEGVPTSLQLVVRVVALLLALLLARWVQRGSPTVFLDAVGVCVRLEMVAGFLALGFGSAATAFVAQNAAAGHLERARQGTAILSLASFLTVFGLGGAIYASRTIVLNAVVPGLPPEGHEVARVYLAISWPAQAWLGAAFVLSRAVNGVGITRLPLQVDLIVLGLVALPLAWVLTRPFLGLAERGVWWALGVSHGFAFLGHAAVARRVWRSWRASGDPPGGEPPSGDRLASVPGGR